MKSTKRRLIIINKSSSLIRTKLKRFLECLVYLSANFNEINPDYTFYQTKEMFFAEYSVETSHTIGISCDRETDPQIEFVLKRFVTFVNTNKTELKAFSKLFPVMMTYFFNPEIYYNDFKNNKFYINFVEVLPRILLGGEFSNILIIKYRYNI